jgi:hypothetical protein
MTVFLPDKNGVPLRVDMGRLIERKPLATVSQEFSSERMMETIRFLASDELKGRALGSKELDQAAENIAQQFREAGLRPAGDSEESYFQAREEIDNTGHKVRMKNIVGVIPGIKPEWSSQSVVIGAHYDHLGISIAENGKEQIYHGADDNASGVAIIIELARLLSKTLTPDRSVIFVAFTGEESGRKGSRYYIAHQQRYPKDQIMGMLNIDTVGRLDQNKLLILGSGSAKEWGHIFKGASHMTGVGIEMVSDELDSSDQKSFQEAGIPAVQFFSGPHLDYHKPTDTADKIDAGGLAKVASVAKEVIEYLASRQEPLTATITTERNIEPEPKKERKVSFGIIPDFGYQGSGCRISGVIQDSAAERANLKEGDIITGINSVVVHRLKDLSDILKSLNPGDKVFISFLREGNEMKIEAEVTERR